MQHQVYCRDKQSGHRSKKHNEWDQCISVWNHEEHTRSWGSDAWPLSSCIPSIHKAQDDCWRISVKLHWLLQDCASWGSGTNIIMWGQSWQTQVEEKDSILGKVRKQYPVSKAPLAECSKVMENKSWSCIAHPDCWLHSTRKHSFYIWEWSQQRAEVLGLSHCAILPMFIIKLQLS